MQDETKHTCAFGVVFVLLGREESVALEGRPGPREEHAGQSGPFTSEPYNHALVDDEFPTFKMITHRFVLHFTQAT